MWVFSTAHRISNTEAWAIAPICCGSSTTTVGLCGRTQVACLIQQPTVSGPSWGNTEPFVYVIGVAPGHYGSTLHKGEGFSLT
jgi:hypothetical protein